MKILIVDDSEQMRQVIRFCLEDLADDIRECADGAEAAQMYAGFKPDWVLIDWQVKKMNGLTATRQILKAYPSARILFVTQFADDFLYQSALEAGAVGYVLKENLFSLREILTSQ